VIRAIAAVDDRLGVGTDHGIPWVVPADVTHFRQAIAGVDVLMGYATYCEFSAPLPDGVNYVSGRRGSELRAGFELVTELGEFLGEGHPGDLWIIGGAALYTLTLPLTDELYLTRVEGDFHCTKFFPAFESTFELVEEVAPPPVAGTPDVRFQTWRRTAAG
jgi:dihydrofolate reductase